MVDTHLRRTASQTQREPQAGERGARPYVSGETGARAVPGFLSKVVPPRVPERRTLRRGRLLERLHDHVAQELRAATVTAPAGYGKTTLLAQFAAEVDALVAWCTLDEHDRDASSLLTYLVAAVARQAPGFGRRTLAAVEEAGGSAFGGGGSGMDAQQLRGAVGLFVTELQEDIPDFLVLILDDCHALAGDAAATAVLDPLLERLPEHCHLILAGRTLPDLTYLRTLAARRQVGRVDAEQLRLTVEETAQLAARTGAAQLDAAQAAALHAQTLGWPMAALLLAPHVGEAEDSAGASAAGGPLVSGGAERGTSAPATPRRRLPERARRELFAYLASEVLGRQPAALQGFLLRASVLPHLEVGRCAALLGRPRDEVARLLGSAEARGLFLTRLDAAPEEAGDIGLDPAAPLDPRALDEPIYYRVHDLFREFLLDTLRTQQPARYRWLQRRASVLAEAAGELPQAIDHVVAGRHFGRAARLITALGPTYVASARWHTLRNWLRALPPAVLDSWPRLLLIKARAEYNLTTDFERAESLLRRAQAALGDDRHGYVQALLARATLLDREGRHSESTEACREATTYLADLPTGLQAEARATLGLALFRVGELEEARRSYETAAGLYAATGDFAGEARARDGLAAVELQRGDVAAATNHLEAALATWRRLSHAPAQARTLNNLGLIKHYVGEFAASRTLLLESAQVASAAGLVRIEACAWLSLGDLERDADNLSAASDAYQRGVHLATKHRDPYMTRYATDAMGQLHRLRGDLAAAEMRARQAVHDARAAGSRYEEGMYLRSLALVHLARRERARARELLDMSLDLLTTCGVQHEIARTRLYRAQLARGVRRRRELRDELTALSQLLADLGYYGFLLGDARQAREVLEVAVGEGMGGDRLASLLADATGVPHVSVPDEPAAEAPTPQEDTRQRGLPVLEAFALGISEVKANGATVSARQWRRSKTKELFFYLLEQRDWTRKDRIIADVWPESSKGAARSAFHTNTHCLRRALHPRLLEERGGHYRLNPDLECWLDAAVFDRLCRANGIDAGSARTAPQSRRHRQDALREAIELYRGPYLDDLGPEWADFRRRQLESLYVEALVELGRERLADGAYDEAAALAERALAIEPYLEPAGALLAAARSEAGRVSGQAARSQERMILVSTL